MSNINDFEITSKGVLKAYNGNEENVVIPEGVKVIGTGVMNSLNHKNIRKIIIPEGVTEISDNAFFMIGFETIVLPKSLKRIGNGAFSHCDKLKNINLKEVENVEIGYSAFDGCTGLTDDNGFLILQDRLFAISPSAYINGKLIIPKGIQSIEMMSIDSTERIDIEMSLETPMWKISGVSKTYGFARSLIGRDGSTIAFINDDKVVAKVILATKGETEPKENGAILSISCKDNGFDFENYDNCWAKLGVATNKIRIALTRVLYPYALSESMKNIYVDFLRKKSLDTGKILIENSESELLDKLYKNQILSKSAIPKLIDYANQIGKAEVTALLLDLQNQIKDIPEKKTVLKASKKSDWKNPKAGTNLVGRYTGTEKSIVFPTTIAGVNITGIADTSGKTPDNYLKLTSVVIPEGYTYIGKKAFAGCCELETIIFPESLQVVETGAFADCRKLKELYIGKNVYLAGNEIFAGANIDTLVIDATQKNEFPTKCFIGSNIKNLIILGEKFKTKGYAFGNHYEECGGDFVAKWYFPENIYINGRVDTLDIREEGSLLRQIHTLSEFDEGKITDEKLRSIISVEKSNADPILAEENSPAESKKVTFIDFSSSSFVLSGFDYFQEFDIKKIIEALGGTVKEGVSSKIQYLIIPDGDVVKTSKYKKAIELQEKGKDISIINESELKRQKTLYNEKKYGKEAAEIADKYEISFCDEKVILEKYTGNEEEVVVPISFGEYPITAISKKCFCMDNPTKGTKDVKHIKRITIQSNISEIADYAFQGCSELINVDLADSVVKIGECAFLDCIKLESIKLPDSLQYIEDSAFARCEKLRGITIPKDVISIVSPLGFNDSLVEISVDERNKTYDSRNNCNAIIETATNTLVAGCKTTEIPGSVRAIGDSAFQGISAIERFIIPEGVERIGNNVFSGCHNLRSIQFPNSLTVIGAYLFNEYSDLKEVELPRNLKKMHISALGGNVEFENVIIPDSLTDVVGLDDAWIYNVRVKKFTGSSKSLAKQIAKKTRAEYVEI